MIQEIANRYGQAFVDLLYRLPAKASHPGSGQPHRAKPAGCVGRRASSDVTLILFNNEQSISETKAPEQHDNQVLVACSITGFYGFWQ